MKQDKGERVCVTEGQECYLIQAVKENLCDRATFKQRPKEGKGVSWVSGGKAIPEEGGEKAETQGEASVCCWGCWHSCHEYMHRHISFQSEQIGKLHRVYLIFSSDILDFTDTINVRTGKKKTPLCYYSRVPENGKPNWELQSWSWHPGPSSFNYGNMIIWKVGKTCLWMDVTTPRCTWQMGLGGTRSV